VSVNSPRFTSNPPQIHHKKTTIKTPIFAKPPVKTTFHHSKKNLTFLPGESSSYPLSKAKRKRKLFYI
jgi:hypothetical protein